MTLDDHILCVGPRDVPSGETRLPDCLTLYLDRGAQRGGRVGRVDRVARCSLCRRTETEVGLRMITSGSGRFCNEVPEGCLATATCYDIAAYLHGRAPAPRLPPSKWSMMIVYSPLI